MMFHQRLHCLFYVVIMLFFSVFVILDSFIFIILAGFFGLYGLTLSFLYFLIYTTNITSFKKPYFAPIAPFEKTYFNNSVLKSSIKKDVKRSTLFTHKNIIKQKEDKE